MVHKPKHKVHSFRGLLADDGQDEINLERQNVNLAYRIIKFSIMTKVLAAASVEHTVKIYREEQSSIDNTINFTDVDLLAAGVTVSRSDAYNAPIDDTVIFDNILFSRNIYVTHSEGQSTEDCNYYIEIEEVPVGAATLMQLKLGVARKLSLSENPPDA